MKWGGQHISKLDPKGRPRLLWPCSLLTTKDATVQSLKGPTRAFVSSNALPFWWHIFDGFIIATMTGTSRVQPILKIAELKATKVASNKRPAPLRARACPCSLHFRSNLIFFFLFLFLLLSSNFHARLKKARTPDKQKLTR